MVKLSVLIPAFNEEKTIEKVLRAIAEQTISGVQIETIVINDASTDRTQQVLEAYPELYLRVVVLEKNAGKGAAIIAGLRIASGDYVLVQDADLEYSPNEYGTLLKPVLDFDAELVIGSRFLAPTWTRVNYFWHKVGNRIITWSFNILNNSTFTDIYSGYILFKRGLVSPDELNCFRWDQQAEILSKIYNRTTCIYEVAINYNGRTYDEGKKIRAHHAISVLWTILRERLMRL
jgi:glycosyltransferase involved in cell wall biosynthesis